MHTFTIRGQSRQQVGVCGQSSLLVQNGVVVFHAKHCINYMIAGKYMLSKGSILTLWAWKKTRSPYIWKLGVYTEYD